MASAQLIVSGSLIVMPLTVTGTTTSVSPTGAVPAGTMQIPLDTTPSPKQSNRNAKLETFVSSPGGFQVLRGVGTADSVTTADFLYLKSDAGVQVQLTQQNFSAGGVGSTVSVVYLYGVMRLEFPVSGYLTALAVQGTANVEWLVSGPA